MKAFRVATIALSLSLAVVAALHVVLLASDSETYRRWVFLQMALLFTCAALLWASQGARAAFLASAVAVAAPAIFINYTYLNYGGSAAVWVLPALVASTVGGVAIYQRLGHGRQRN
nr:hypothetical protein [uncultured Rhodoferax sp.]